MFNLGTGEIIIILVIFLILFGAKKIPELAQGLGKGIKEFKKSMKDIEEDISISDKSQSSEKEKKAE